MAYQTVAIPINLSDFQAFQDHSPMSNLYK